MRKTYIPLIITVLTVSSLCLATILPIIPRIPAAFPDIFTHIHLTDGSYAITIDGTDRCIDPHYSPDPEVGDQFTDWSANSLRQVRQIGKNCPFQEEAYLIAFPDSIREKAELVDIGTNQQDGKVSIDDRVAIEFIKSHPKNESFYLLHNHSYSMEVMEPPSFNDYVVLYRLNKSLEKAGSNIHVKGLVVSLKGDVFTYDYTTDLEKVLAKAASFDPSKDRPTHLTYIWEWGTIVLAHPNDPNGIINEMSKYGAEMEYYPSAKEFFKTIGLRYPGLHRRSHRKSQTQEPYLLVASNSF